MIDPVVRRGVPADAESLAELERAARASLADTRGGDRWLDTHDAIGDGWSRALGQRGVFVAEIDGVPVGYLVADVVEDPRPVVLIDQVYVEPDARQLGFGDELVAAATAWGRDAGASYVEGHALPGDRDTKNLYERAGITARLIIVSKPL